jgi:hypothetical protein
MEKNYLVEIDGIVRDATPEELAQIEKDRTDKIAELSVVSAGPSKEQLLAQLTALQEQIQSLQ